jgi:hypothetical protein
MTFIFIDQGDKRRSDWIAKIDVVLLKGVVEPLLESSIVVKLLKLPFLVRNDLKY